MSALLKPTQRATSILLVGVDCARDGRMGAQLPPYRQRARFQAQRQRDAGGTLLEEACDFGLRISDFGFHATALPTA